MTPAESSLAAERVLILLPPGAQTEQVQSVLNEAMLTYQVCDDVQGVRNELERGAGTAILSHELLTPQAMRQLIEVLNRQESWSDLPLVILFDQGDQSFLAGLRILNLLEPLGNFSILQQPINGVELVSAIKAALRARRRQYQLRNWLQRWDRAIRHRDRFLSLLAHELRNPLSAIRNSVDILGHLGPQTQQLVEQRSLIARQTTRLAVSVDEMLDIYQVLSGKVRLRRQPTDLGPLATRALAFVEAEAKAQRQVLRLSKEERPLLVDGDEQRMQQVMNHLLMSAIQSTQLGGRIELALSRAASEAVVRVTLSDANLSAEMLAGLFDQFSDLDDVLERPSEGGLGIGLTLVQGLVKLQGGSLTARPSPAGLGLEFHVRFPLARAETAAPLRAAGSRSTGPRRVLVIEDNRDSRDSLRLMLQLWGHEVMTAADGTEGVAKALAEHPEIVLSDIGLPGQDGYEVARQIRAALGSDVVLIAMTGFGLPHDRQRALESGFDRYLVKPIIPNELQELIVDLSLADRPQGRGPDLVSASR